MAVQIFQESILEEEEDHFRISAMVLLFPSRKSFGSRIEQDHFDFDFHFDYDF